MKRTIEMILMSLLMIMVAVFVGSTLMGCSSDDDIEFENHYEESIIGIWQLLNYDGGFSGHSVDVEPGAIILTFTKDGEMQSINKIDEQFPFPTGTYKYSFVEIERSIFTGSPATVLLIGQDLTWGSHYSFSYNEETLLLAQEAFDGFNYKLKKVK